MLSSHDDGDFPPELFLVVTRDIAELDSPAFALCPRRLALGRAIGDRGYILLLGGAIVNGGWQMLTVGEIVRVSGWIRAGSHRVAIPAIYEHQIAA